MVVAGPPVVLPVVAVVIVFVVVVLVVVALTRSTHRVLVGVAVVPPAVVVRVVAPVSPMIPRS